MQAKTYFEQMYFTAIRLEVFDENGQIGMGTCCIFDYKEKGKRALFLVTNKHVVKDSKTGKITFNQKTTGASEYPTLGDFHTIEIADFGRGWIFHPEDNIDIAILPFTPILNQLPDKGSGLFFLAIGDELIPSEKALSEEIDAIEEVLFVGYPNDVYDKKNLLPIVRKGLTSTPISIDFEGEPAFLIDASIFPGSSGSPVFICNIGSFHLKSGGLNVGNRVYFLGIVSSVYFREENDLLRMVDVPTRRIPISSTKQMIDLGKVYKSSIIRDLAKDFLKSRGEID